MKCGTFEPGIASREGGHIYEGVSGTLRANPGDNQMAVYGVYENHGQDTRFRNSKEVSQTVTASWGEGRNNCPFVVKAYGVVAKGNGDTFINDTTHTALSCGGGEPGQGYPCVLEVYGSDHYNQDIYREVEPTLGANCGISTGRNGVVFALKRESE